MVTITGATTRDCRFPTSLDKTGSDAMNAAGDYSAAYVILETDTQHKGHGMTFTIGRGNEIVCQAIAVLSDRIKGKKLEDLVADWGKTWRYLVSDSHLRWIGPEKGVIHLALGSLVNAIWDLWAKVLGKPVWRIVAEMSPEEFVRCIDFRYITDAITPEEAIQMLKEQEPTKAQRIKDAEQNRAVPAYTTSAGWLGYGEDKMKGLLQETLGKGYKHFKLKVGTSLEQDKKRLSIARDVIGYDKGNILMVDANQVWSVPEAIDYMKQLAEFKPWFIEEPTSPDDVFGHKAIRDALKPHGIGVATGEMCQNRVIFKQLIVQGAIDVCQIDACRIGGVNEVLAVLLIAKKYGVPIVPHSGGVGLPEYTQHLSTIDYVCVSGKLSVLEYVDHLHEHFFHPSVIKDGYYTTPTEPGYSVEMKPASMDQYEFPGKEGCVYQDQEPSEPVNYRFITERPEQLSTAPPPASRRQADQSRLITIPEDRLRSIEARVEGLSDMVAVLRGHRSGERDEGPSGARHLSDVGDPRSVNLDDVKRSRDREVFERMVREVNELSGLLGSDRGRNVSTAGQEHIPAPEAPSISPIVDWDNAAALSTNHASRK
ncbi:hypothetical protein D0868_01040 [Hortaea werneckii]|uniref:Mandelate racemase/muconate lactonizing enzyme C-terminal domain-containing protein n=1 Tax=Hortaea werneckii TaxID=91943 RepID=A0A3M6ZJ12_HORWE|nr:hypothetical protein D0868_01040 [Hortaea werneckii]